MLRFLLSIFILLFCFAAVSAQNKIGVEVFADVPTDKRTRLIERFEIFIRYYRERDKTKIYDLIGEQAKRGLVGGLSRERFIKEVYLPKLKKFEVEDITELKTEQGTSFGIWIISGCGEYSRFGPNKKLESRIEAYWQNSDWYFSEVVTPFPLHGEPRECNWKSASRAVD